MMQLTAERRTRQLAYNQEHGIVPRGVTRAIDAGLRSVYDDQEIERKVVAEAGETYDAHVTVQMLEREMLEAAQALEFERAAALRDEWMALKKKQE